MDLKVTVKGISQLRRDLKAESKRQKRALDVALKVEGFKRLKQLRSEIRKGTPAGRRYAKQLSEIARRTKTGRMKKRQIPLYRLAQLLRYNVDYRRGNLQMSFGFVSTGRRQISGTWKSLVLKHAAGTDVLYSGSRTELGRRLARIGGKMKKRNDPDARFFFLRRTTGRKINLPPRPIVDPFFREYDDDMKRSIRRNYRRKLRGIRI